MCVFMCDRKRPAERSGLQNFVFAMNVEVPLLCVCVCVCVRACVCVCVSVLSNKVCRSHQIIM